MTYVYEYAEDNPHLHCHKIEVTTGEDLRLGRRAYIDQRCEECRADISEMDRLRTEIQRLRTLIVEWADSAEERAANIRSGLSDSGKRHYDACELLAAEA